MAQPWDVPQGPNPEKDKTARIRAAIKTGTFGKTPPAKKVGEIGLTDAYGQEEKRRAKVKKITRPYAGPGSR